MVTKFCVVVPFICGSSVYDMLHITLLVTKIFEVAVKFLENLCSLKIGISISFHEHWNLPYRFIKHREFVNHQHDASCKRRIPFHGVN
jgi:hypothetical protein